MNASVLLKNVKDIVFKVLPTIQEMRYDVTWKSDGSPVTAADIFLEREVASYLHSELPGLQFIGEESWRSGTLSSENWVAVLDPIDGTENFCSGLKEWGTSLSIWRGGEHLGSMLLMPELDQWALSGDIPRIPRSRIVGFSSSYNDEIGRGVAENPESRIMGCAVYNLFNVIRGAYARFVNPRGAYSWDLLAGIVLADEVGCEVLVNGVRYDRRFLEPGQRYCVDIRHRYDFHPG